MKKNNLMLRQYSVLSAALSHIVVVSCRQSGLESTFLYGAKNTLGKLVVVNGLNNQVCVFNFLHCFNCAIFLKMEDINNEHLGLSYIVKHFFIPNDVGRQKKWFKKEVVMRQKQ